MKTLSGTNYKLKAKVDKQRSIVMFHVKAQIAEKQILSPERTYYECSNIAKLYVPFYSDLDPIYLDFILNLFRLCPNKTQFEMYICLMNILMHFVRG